MDSEGENVVEASADDSDPSMDRDHRLISNIFALHANIHSCKMYLGINSKWEVRIWNLGESWGLLIMLSR